MSSARGNNNSISCNAYAQQRIENIEKNKRKLAALNIPIMAQQVQPRKKQKKIHDTNTARIEGPNLRPRPERNRAQIEEERVFDDLHLDGDLLNNSGGHQNSNVNNGTKNRKGRGITKKDDIFSRTPDMPKLKILLNGYGQPIGENARQLSSVIGCQVRKKISIACKDWRLIDVEKKYELWDDIKSYFDIDPAALNWVMRTAGRKWKEFKSTIKELYFDPDLSLDEIEECPDKRVSDADWKFLYEYWLTSEFQARSKAGKVSRQKVQLLHTSGSVSFACSEHKLAMKLGRPPRRDETFIKTHTRKNGVPSIQAEPIINKLKDVVQVYPELKEKTIQEGDVFALVCGEKEPKGYIRAVGLGPTPQDIGTPGLKGYAPTRLQMEILARTKAEKDKAALEKRILQLQAEIEERAQLDRASEGPMSQHGSTSRQNVNSRLEHGDEDNAYGDDDCNDEDTIAPSTAPGTNDASHSKHNSLVGREAILYALLRSDQPVAKGIIVSTNPSTIVADLPIGRQFCEVVVTCVLKRDAVLARPYDDMQTMATAHMMSLAWPYKKLKVINKASATPNTSPNISGNGQC
ncbi:uncharacterized protein [Zea mays]|uniref:uncharacterized protein n=1 Tax=Zea mays TaxID=4577 RepID=UPI0004DE9C04|nr:uncharacterized protein LOC103638237 [Zea mays]XP_020399893.1 uncharacterized protein LOC109942364 [Zea mays]XP_020402799.1 uncharacterized protein LOC103642009 [Zea mays]XP_020406697.1 uncharacterized protein LOC103650297 [Zea mays]XP_035822226.1 uncharacterized protein LOC103650730 [Zea mays]|eukprot:XP_020399890.1 uncharacterized protein LOC103638237 [Zea mays]